MPTKEKNLERLEKLRPDLVELYNNAGSGKVETLISKSSLPVFKFGGVAAHSVYKPEEEGARFADGLAEDINNNAKDVWVFGLGYAYHLRGLIKKGIKLTVMEPSPEIFRSAVDNVDMTEIIEKCDLVVGGAGGGDLREKIYESDLKNAVLVAHRPYQNFFERDWEKVEAAFTVRSFIARKGLRVMLVGPIYGGSETTFRYVETALKRIGVDVITFDATPFADGFFEIAKITPNETHTSQLRSLYSSMLGEGAVALADYEKPDLILVMAQAPLDVSALERLRQLKSPLALWFVEDFLTLKYWERVAKYYDYFFTIQKGGFIAKLAAAGARNIAYLPQAASPDRHFPMELSQKDIEKYGSDISFMGAGYYNRKQFFMGLLDYDFNIWGTEWDLNTDVGRRVQNENNRMKPEEYVKIFSASKININLHSSTALEGIDPIGDFVNPRVFEIAACGGFQLVDNRHELAELMECGKEVETFSSLDELRDKIDHYLKNKDERLEIAEAGRKRVLADHTFERRMEDLLAAIIINEGDSLAKERKKNHYARNIVGNMIKEAGDDGELAAFLKNFDPEKPLSLKEAVEQISEGKGALSRTEALMAMVDQVLVQ